MCFFFYMSDLLILSQKQFRISTKSFSFCRENYDNAIIALLVERPTLFLSGIITKRLLETLMFSE